MPPTCRSTSTATSIRSAVPRLREVIMHRPSSVPGFALLFSLCLLCSLLLPPGAAAAPDEPLDHHPEWDQSYSRKIREATTEHLQTDLVDHLPASDRVPTPEKANGYIAGAPDHLTYAEDVHRYMQALAAASPRVKVFSLGQSEEGREMILVAISDEDTIAHLDRYKEITRKLADPRHLSAAEAQQL